MVVGMPNPIILIVEDDIALASAYRLSLQNAGYEAHTLYSAQGLLEWLEWHSADLILLDLNLPDGWGVDLLPSLRAALPATARIIAITGNARSVESREDEFDLVLLKPISLRQLLELVNRLCERPLTESELGPD